MKANAILPLTQAVERVPNTPAGALITQALTYLQGPAATTLGYAVRSLGSSYNALASERKETVLRVQSTEVKAALTDLRPGFDTFLEGDIPTALAIASTTAQLRMTQAALSRLGGNPRPSRGSFSGRRDRRLLQIREQLHRWFPRFGQTKQPRWCTWLLQEVWVKR